MTACRLSLRLRLMLGALILAGLAVTAAGIAAYGLSRSQALATEAVAAQHRIEGYLTLSARVNEWSTGWLFGASPPPADAVLAAFATLDRLIAADVEAAPDAGEAAARDRQQRIAARIRGQFDELAAALARHGQGSAEAQAALAFYGAQGPAQIAGQIQVNAGRRDAALQAMEAMRRVLHRLALAVAVLAPLTLVALHLWLIRPLAGRLRGAARSAEGLSLAGGADRHDELGLLFARVRQMTARLDRRQRRLAAGHAQLEGIVADRTRELSDANARLSRADAERRRFFADVGHELRTPLTVILGEAELGLRETDPARRESFATIHGRAMRLYRRIEDLLRIARSESGQIDLRVETVDLRGVVAAAVADARPILTRAGVSLRVAAAAPVLVPGDPDWLRQVLAGILENAAKYAGRGAEVAVAVAAEAGLARLTVTDDGPGIPAPELGAVFERFRRGADADSRRAAGFGVGLALARWVVEAHGGSIAALPPPDGRRGLTLHLTLPLAAAAPLAAHTETEEA